MSAEFIWGVSVSGFGGLIIWGLNMYSKSVERDWLQKDQKRKDKQARKQAALDRYEALFSEVAECLLDNRRLVINTARLQKETEDEADPVPKILRDDWERHNEEMDRSFHEQALLTGRVRLLAPFLYPVLQTAMNAYAEVAQGKAKMVEAQRKERIVFATMYAVLGIES